MEAISSLMKTIFSIQNNPNGLGIIGEHEFIFRVVAFSTVILMIIANGFAGKNTRIVSNTFHLYVTPPGVMFAIWGIIYLILLSIGIYTLIHNVWTVEIYVLAMISNFLNAIWTPIFVKNSTTYNNICFVILIALFLVNQMQWVELGRLSFGSIYQNEILGNVLVRNGLSFYQGWLVGAANLNTGIVLVYSLGMDKKLQLKTFWVLAPLCVIIMTYLNTQVYGKLNDTLAMFISAVYALTGAMITSIKCLNGNEKPYEVLKEEALKK